MKLSLPSDIQVEIYFFNCNLVPVPIKILHVLLILNLRYLLKTNTIVYKFLFCKIVDVFFSI